MEASLGRNPKTERSGVNLGARNLESCWVTVIFYGRVYSREWMQLSEGNFNKNFY